MCIFNYILHACGHASYRYTRPTHFTCRPTNLCAKVSLETMAEEQYHLLQSSSVSKHACVGCVNGFTDKGFDPYLKNLVGIVGLLELELLSVGDDEYVDGEEEVMKAWDAVLVLGRMQELYHECVDSRPGREEMRGYVKYAVECVEGATKGIEKRSHAELRALADEEAFLEELEEEMSFDSEEKEVVSAAFAADADFSQGTIDRQLCNLHQAVPPQHYPSVAYRAPSYSPTPSRAYPARSATPYSAIQSPTKDFMKTVVLSRPFFAAQATQGTSVEVDSIITDPFCSSPVSASGTMLVSVLGMPTVKTYLDGRDNWECDICGPECFCYGLDD